MAKEKQPVSTDKMELLKEEMEKKYGKGSVVMASSKKDFEVISTGSLLLDKVTDCGGLPRGKLIEMFGPESSGKSTISLHFIAEFQKAGLKCVYADFEHSFDKTYAGQIGVNLDPKDGLIIIQPDTMEDGYNMIYDFIKSGLVGLIVIDSHTSMVPKDRREGEIGDAKYAPEARLNSVGLKMIKADIEKYQCTVLGISQLRAEIGKMNGGNAPTGGNAWKFYTDMRFKVYKTLDRTNETNDTFVEVVKNKCGKPFGKAEIPIAWGVGIDKMQELINVGVEMKVIKKAGSWYSWGDDKIGQGGKAVKAFLSDNPEAYEEIKAQTLALYKDAVLEVVVPEEGKEDDIPTIAVNQ